MFVIKNNTTNKYLHINKHSANVWCRDEIDGTHFETLKQVAEAMDLFRGMDLQAVEVVND